MKVKRKRDECIPALANLIQRLARMRGVNRPYTGPEILKHHMDLLSGEISALLELHLYDIRVLLDEKRRLEKELRYINNGKLL